MTDSEFTVGFCNPFSEIMHHRMSGSVFYQFFTHKGISVYDDITLLINRVLYSIPMFVDAAFYPC